MSKNKKKKVIRSPYGYNCTVSLMPYEDGVTNSAVVAAPDSGVSTRFTTVLGDITRSVAFCEPLVETVPIWLKAVSPEATVEI